MRVTPNGALNASACVGAVWTRAHCHSLIGCPALANKAFVRDSRLPCVRGSSVSSPIMGIRRDCRRTGEDSVVARFFFFFFFFVAPLDHRHGALEHGSRAPLSDRPCEVSPAANDPPRRSSCMNRATLGVTAFRSSPCGPLSVAAAPTGGRGRSAGCALVDRVNVLGRRSRATLEVHRRMGELAPLVRRDVGASTHEQHQQHEPGGCSKVRRRAPRHDQFCKPPAFAHEARSAVALALDDGPPGGMSPPSQLKHDDDELARADDEPLIWPFFFRYE